MNQAIIWSPGVSLEEIQKQVIHRALSFYHQDKKTTAEALKVPLKYIEKKMNQYEKEKNELEEKRKELKEKQDEYAHRARGLRQDPLTGKYQGHRFG